MGITLRTTLFTLVVPGSVTILGPYLLLTSGPKVLTLDIGALRALGIAPILIGAVLYGWTVTDFARSGMGTPAPIDPPRRLVAPGLYRVIRNPMYLGVELVVLGESLLFQSITLLMYSLLAGGLFHLFVVLCEEPNLRRRFGEDYIAYCRAVPRWIPRRRSSDTPIPLERNGR